MRKTLLVMSGKGGTGKTTIAVNLSYSLLGRGKSVGILDADIHGPDVLMLMGQHGMRMEISDGRITPIQIDPKLKVASIAGFVEDESAIIWRGPMKHNAIKQLANDVEWGELDYLVVDFPPGTGDEHISAAQLIKDIVGAVIVSTPQQVSLLDAMRAIDFCNRMGVPVIGLIENMSGGIFGEGSVERLCRNKKLNFLGALPLCKEIVQSGAEGKPFFEYGNAALNQKFDSIMRKILGDG